MSPPTVMEAVIASMLLLILWMDASALFWMARRCTRLERRLADIERDLDLHNLVNEVAEDMREMMRGGA